MIDYEELIKRFESMKDLDSKTFVEIPQRQIIEPGNLLQPPHQLSIQFR
jgi:hypothetical protein